MGKSIRIQRVKTIPLYRSAKDENKDNYYLLLKTFYQADHSEHIVKYGPVRRNLSFGFATRCGSTQPAQLQRQARIMKFVKNQA